MGIGDSSRRYRASSQCRFRQPVNLKDVPTYLNFVTRAMDLGTIRSNMRKNAYKTPMDFHDDVSQVWENCAAYNGQGTPCRNDGEYCRSMFLSAWKDMKIEEEWKKLQVEIDPSVRLRSGLAIESQQEEYVPSCQPKGLFFTPHHHAQLLHPCLLRRRPCRIESSSSTRSWPRSSTPSQQPTSLPDPDET